MNKRFNSRWVKSKKLKLILFIRNSYIQHISQSVSGQFLIAKMQLYKSLCVSVAKLKIFPEVSHGYPRLLIQSCHTSLHFRKKAPFGLS